MTWVFDDSSCYNAYADDALNASRINAKPDEKQPHIHDTMWQGNVQLDDMRKEIANHPDFTMEK